MKELKYAIKKNWPKNDFPDTFAHYTESPIATSDSFCWSGSHLYLYYNDKYVNVMIIIIIMITYIMIKFTTF